MADDKKEEAKAAPKVKAADLGPAGESINPEVQQAIAELEIAERNRDALNVPVADVESADAAVKAAKAKLKGLGVQ